MSSQKNQPNHGMPAEDQIVCPETECSPDLQLELNGKKLTLSLDSLSDWVGLALLVGVIGSAVYMILQVVS